MDERSLTSDPARVRSPAARWLTGTSLLALFVGHVWLTLQLFGPIDLWQNLTNNEPIISGRHGSILLYSGPDVGQLYDASSYAGYPRSSVGPCELSVADRFLRLTGRRIDPITYKLGLVIIWSSLPLVLWLSASALRLPALARLVTVAGGVLVIWSGPFHRMIADGSPGLAVAVAAVTGGLALLDRWRKWPCPLTWCGLVACFAAGWSAHAPVWGAFAGLSLGWWAAAGRGQSWVWHFGLLMANASAFILGYASWADWLHDWWLRLPISPVSPSVFVPAEGLPPAADRLIGTATWASAATLVVAAVVGAGQRWTGGGRCPLLSAAVGAALAFGAAVATSRWLPAISPSLLLAIALWLALLPAAALATDVLARVEPGSTIGVGIASALFLFVAGVLAQKPPVGDPIGWGPRPLAVGLPVDARQVEDVLRRTTTSTARILWEDFGHRSDLGWAALLPSRLGRAFIGGSDPSGALDYAACALRDGQLAGRLLAAWTDEELEAYCRRYNVGWIVCASNVAGDRFARWPAAVPVATPDGAAGWRVFEIRRPHSYLLKGQASDYDASAGRVTFKNVVPENGEVVISLHYMAGCRARPSWVRVERDLDPYDPIPFVRLCMPGPASRVTLTWDRD